MQGRGGVVARRTQDPSSGGCLWAMCVQGADSSGQTGVALREPPPPPAAGDGGKGGAPAPCRHSASQSPAHTARTISARDR